MPRCNCFHSGCHGTGHGDGCLNGRGPSPPPHVLPPSRAPSCLHPPALGQLFSASSLASIFALLLALVLLRLPHLRFLFAPSDLCLDCKVYLLASPSPSNSAGSTYVVSSSEINRGAIVKLANKPRSQTILAFEFATVCSPQCSPLIALVITIVSLRAVLAASYTLRSVPAMRKRLFVMVRSLGVSVTSYTMCATPACVGCGSFERTRCHGLQVQVHASSPLHAVRSVLLQRLQCVFESKCWQVEMRATDALKTTFVRSLSISTAMSTHKMSSLTDKDIRVCGQSRSNSAARTLPRLISPFCIWRTGFQTHTLFMKRTIILSAQSLQHANY